MSVRRALRRALGLVGVAITACSEQPDAGSVDATRRDSAGVQLFEYAQLPVDVGSLRLGAHPSLVLGGLQEHDSLEFDARSVFRSAAQLADGQVVVGDHQRLRYYDRRGRLLRTVGRGGRGPGEFTSIRDLCAQADSTLLVLDDDSRWTVWDRHGVLKDDHPRVGLIPYHACSAQGDLIVRELPTERELITDGTRALPYALYRRDGTRQQTLGTLAASDYYAAVFFEPSFGVLGKDFLIAVPREGSREREAVNVAGICGRPRRRAGVVVDHAMASLRPLVCDRRRWAPLADPVAVPARGTTATCGLHQLRGDRLALGRGWCGSVRVLRTQGPREINR